MKHLAIWRDDHDVLPNRIDHSAKVFLALSQLLLGALAVIDVCMERIPAPYLAFRISRWYGAHLEPPVNPIRASKTGLDVKDLARFERRCPSLRYAGKIRGMNDTDAAPVFQLLICFA